MDLNSDLQPLLKINSPSFKSVYKFKRNFDLTNVFLFEKASHLSTLKT